MEVMLIVGCTLLGMTGIICRTVVETCKQEHDRKREEANLRFLKEQSEEIKQLELKQDIEEAIKSIPTWKMKKLLGSGKGGAE